MSLSPNEKEAVATALKGVDKATHAMLKALSGQHDDDQIIADLSIAIGELELAQSPLIAARNDLHERKEDNNG
ncbi:hypothetical protein [Limosilactobacillus mucosae]|uniref:Uncharacterized protein n=1 Tax=Limosilactobacillus mucosae TaxID=97478 RepID=A0A508YLY1_LIMMU|nr:hypothetical protein [Limosilactobacillus mucosae]VTZ89797.1 hypothetical protein LMUP508_00923 [Limosilactobacillus mucosae]